MSKFEKIKDAVAILDLLNMSDTNTHNASNNVINVFGEIRIVILQRGWVVIGRYYQNEHDCSIKNGYVIRKWGTTKGLGEIAIDGPTQETILDPIPLTKFHELTIVASMICTESKWISKIA